MPVNWINEMRRTLFRNIYKEISLIVCLLGLLYQTIILLVEFWSGETVVNIRVSPQQEDAIPGITICLPHSYLSIVSAHQKIGKELIEQFSNYVISSQKYNVARYYKPEEAEEIFRDLKKSLNEIVSKVQTTVPAHEILSNYSLQLYEFVVEVHGNINGTEQVDLIMSQFKSQKGYNFEIVESLYNPGSDLNMQLKCFTFFSSLSNTTRHLKLNLAGIGILINGSKRWHTIDLFDHVQFAIHSPNSLPVKEEFRTLLTSKSNLIKYNQLKTELLDSRYDTNCFKYDLDYKFANFNMRSDCMTDCIQKTLGLICNVSDLVDYGGPLRMQFLEQTSNKLLHFSSDVNELGCEKENLKLAKTKCGKSCLKDCTYTYYPYINDDEHKAYRENALYITILHNSMPDITIIYLPQSTLLSLVCNFAGLIGMWLGSSFFHSFNYIYLSIKHKFRNFINNDNNSISIEVNQRRRRRVRNNNLYSTRRL